MAFDVAGFRKSYPEFSDTGRFTDGMINNWATIATALVNPSAWGTQVGLGINLYVAHEITLQAQSVATAALGGTPGQQSGPVNSKTVGSVTAAYDTQQIAEKDAGHWNATMYGKQFLRLSRIFGAGAIQL